MYSVPSLAALIALLVCVRGRACVCVEWLSVWSYILPWLMWSAFVYCSHTDCPAVVRVRVCVECAITVVVLIALLVYFPSRPFYPPSYTAGLTKTNFCAGLRDLFRWHNANFWLMCVSLSLIVSVYGVWNGIFDINLQYTGLKNSEVHMRLIVTQMLNGGYI